LREEAIAAYDALIERFGGADELELLKQVAAALFNKGVQIGELDRSEEAIEIYDDLLARYGEETDAGLRLWLARALFMKSFTLCDMDLGGDAVEVLGGGRAIETRTLSR
jgi:tetratricopeptide (TPR) repeat protein